MRITDYLNTVQLDKIQSVIRNQCENAARNVAEESRGIPDEVYKRLKKGRRSHDITSDIYIALYRPENAIEGLSVELIDNGNYTQPELVNDHVLIHIYHHSNNLNSRLVQNRNTEDKPFFCIKYEIDNRYRLKSIKSVNVASSEIETLYEAPRVVQLAS